MQTDENVGRVKESVFTNRRISICEVANMLQTSFVSVQGIMKDNLDVSVQAIMKDNLDISETATKFVLWLMSNE
jgi:predicted transcriptional regulator